MLRNVTEMTRNDIKNNQKNVNQNDNFLRNKIDQKHNRMQRQESLNLNHHYNNEFGLHAGINQIKDS